MPQVSVNADAYTVERERLPALSIESSRQLGLALREIYEGTLDTQPIPDEQVDLLLRLRHKERELRRAS